MSGTQYVVHTEEVDDTYLIPTFIVSWHEIDAHAR